MKARIVVLPGDGIGPEVTAAAVEVLRAVAEQLGGVRRPWTVPDESGRIVLGKAAQPVPAPEPQS